MLETMKFEREIVGENFENLNLFSSQLYCATSFCKSNITWLRALAIDVLYAIFFPIFIKKIKKTTKTYSHQIFYNYLPNWDLSQLLKIENSHITKSWPFILNQMIYKII